MVIAVLGHHVLGGPLPHRAQRAGHRRRRGRSGVDHLEEHVLRLRRAATRRRWLTTLRQLLQDAGRDERRRRSATASRRCRRRAPRRAVGVRRGGRAEDGLPERGLPVRQHRRRAGGDGDEERPASTASPRSTDPNTAFALVTGLRNAGANIKVAIFPTGYGGDLTQAGPGALTRGAGRVLLDRL